MEPGRSRHDGEWLDLVADLLAAPLTRWPAEQVVQQLVATFEAPAGTYYGRAPHGPPVQLQWPPELFAAHRAEIERWTLHDAPRAHPLLRYYLASGDGRATQVADVPTRFADERVQAGWREWCRSFHDADVSSQVALPVAYGGSAARTFIVGRSDPFSPREMDLARRLQHLLTGLDRQIAVVARWSAHTGPLAPDVAAALTLTPRELAVLHLLATGVTARAIAHRLTIAERTVQKHLQRLYAKLGVADRLAAVRHAQYLGLLAHP